LQIGMTRAGWYSYDLLDNLGWPSARRILPQLQNPKIGDVIPMSPDGKQGMFFTELPVNSPVLGCPHRRQRGSSEGHRAPLVAYNVRGVGESCGR